MGEKSLGCRVNHLNPSDTPFNTNDHTPLSEIIFQTLSKSNPAQVRFDQFMEIALYHSQHGYYASSIDRKIGRGGDFYTSVSVGDTFGWILGFAIECGWTSEQPLVLCEQGCHNGQLALDIIKGLEVRDSPLLANLKYYLVESNQKKRADLIKEIDSDYIIPVGSFDEITETCGVFLCNELLDAFPVRRFSRKANEWLELFVISGDSEYSLKESWQPVDRNDGFDRFLQLVEPFYSDWPDDYQTEFCQPIDQWVSDIARLFPEQGRWLIFDYGMGAERYFEPSRRTGTLKCYHNHQTHEAATWLPGRCDISAHVNYTHLKNAANACGLELKIEDQGQFLTLAATQWLLSLEGTTPSGREKSRLQQFQTLTHPAMMGRSFQVVEMGRKN